MSYAIVGLGVAKAAESCNGGEVSDDGLGNRGDFCCKVATWSARTYKQIKGNSSWRRWREKVLRLALENILAPSDMGLPTKLHQIAYNAGLNEKAAVSQALVNDVATTLNNFRTLFPPDRWYKEQNCKRGDYDGGVCTGGEKTLSCWKSKNPPHTSAMAALLTQVVGAPVTTQHLSSIGKWDQPSIVMSGSQAPNVPKAFYDWVTAIHREWQNMPLALNNYVNGNERVPKPEELFLAQGGVVKPVAWMANFMAAMKPKRAVVQVAPSAAHVTYQPKATISKGLLERTVRPAPAPDVAAPAPPAEVPAPQPEGMDPKMLAIGGVAIVAVGFGAFVVLRKK